MPLTRRSASEGFIGTFTLLLEPFLRSVDRGGLHAPPPQVLLTTATLRAAHAARLAAAFPAAHSLSHAGALARTLQQTFQYVPRESDKTARLLDLLDAAAAEP